MLDNSLISTLSISKDLPGVFSSVGGSKAAATPPASPFDSAPASMDTAHSEAELAAVRH